VTIEENLVLSVNQIINGKLKKGEHQEHLIQIQVLKLISIKFFGRRPKKMNKQGSER